MSQNSGGAIFARIVCIDNCTFKNNYAADYGGAVDASKVYINFNQTHYQPINTFFIGNKAGDNDGGAIYCTNDIYVKNALFSENKADDDGDAIFSKGDWSYKDVYLDGNVVFVDGNSVKADKIYRNQSKGSFYALDDVINGNENSEVTLSGNYVFNSTYLDDSRYINGITINRSVTINGNGFSIDCLHKAHLFNIGQGAQVKFLNIRFLNGNGYNEVGNKGGAIYAPYEHTCVVENCSFFANTANYGRAVYGGSVIGCIFTGNIANVDGGAIYAPNGYACVVENCSFFANTANYGGAVYGGSVIGCNFTGNIARTNGGAVFMLYMEGCFVENSTFNSNSALYGGAMYGAIANNSVFTGNIAERYGGALSEGYANNCSFNNNTADVGGAMFMGTATDCIFNKNIAKKGDNVDDYVITINCTFITDLQVKAD